MCMHIKVTHRIRSALWFAQQVRHFVVVLVVVVVGYRTNVTPADDSRADHMPYVSALGHALWRAMCWMIVFSIAQTFQRVVAL